MPRCKRVDSINLEMRAQTMGEHLVAAERLILAARIICHLTGDIMLDTYLRMAAQHWGLNADVLILDDARFGKFSSSTLRRQRFWLCTVYCRLTQPYFAQL